jgi:hypothetical protein
LNIAKPETQYIWNQEKQLTQIVRADGQTVTLNRSVAKGRLESLSSPEGQQAISYDDKGRVSSQQCWWCRFVICTVTFQLILTFSNVLVGVANPDQLGVLFNVLSPL